MTERMQAFPDQEFTCSVGTAPSRAYTAANLLTNQRALVIACWNDNLVARGRRNILTEFAHICCSLLTSRSGSGYGSSSSSSSSSFNEHLSTVIEYGIISQLLSMPALAGLRARQDYVAQLTQALTAYVDSTSELVYTSQREFIAELDLLLSRQ